jgi:hypothetical protein
MGRSVMDCEVPQVAARYADRPILRPNCSYAYGARVADKLLVLAADG